MTRRVLRWSVLVTLLGVAVGTALFVRKQSDRIRAVDSDLDAITARLDDIAARLYVVSDAQLRYLTLGLTDSSDASDLVSAVTADVQALRQRLQAPGAAARLITLADAARTVAEVDARARDNVRAGETLMAADLVLTGSRAAAASMDTELRALRSGELQTIAARRAGLLGAVWVAVGGAAAFWLVGLLLLVRVPRPAPAAAQPEVARPQPDVAVLQAPPPAPASEPSEPATTIDLAAAAALCTDIARATTTMVLTELLSRASAVLGAPGMIVWMASGDELFAALGVGYDPRVVARLGTIRADADNATAVAWRTGEMQTVRGDLVSRGAIVSPLFGPDGCLGVLAVEVPNGRDTDPDTRAVTTMIGAQLATILAAWPTAPQQPVDPGLIGQGALTPALRVEA
jgi:hypothetical protein